MEILDSGSDLDIPEALFRMAEAYLDAAENLNTQIAAGVWSSSYQRGQVVLFLAFHGAELYVKGCIKKLAPDHNISSHNLPRLSDDLKRLAPELEFEAPFGAEPTRPGAKRGPEEEAIDRVLHQIFRYPMDNEGAPWEGLFSFRAESFGASLRQMRIELTGIRAKVMAR